MENKKIDNYYEDLFKFKDQIEVLKVVSDKIKELSKSFSLKKDFNDNRQEVSEYEVYKKLTTFYFYRDGYNLAKDIVKENKLKSTKDLQNIFKDTKNPLYNNIFANYLKTQVKPDLKEYEALFESDPYKMVLLEKILGSYSIMRNKPEVVAKVINLDIDDKYFEVLLQLNQQISGFNDIKIKTNEGKNILLDEGTLVIKKINEDSINLVSLDSFYENGKFIGKEYNNIPIENVLEVLLDINIDKSDLENKMTDINIVDLKSNNIDKILILENVINELNNNHDLIFNNVLK